MTHYKHRLNNKLSHSAGDKLPKDTLVNIHLDIPDTVSSDLTLLRFAEQLN